MNAAVLAEFAAAAEAAFAEPWPLTDVGRRARANSHWCLCLHRGEPIATVSGSEACCGCASMHVEVYRCKQFGEPVLKQSDPRCLDRLAAKFPGYTGRTCRECKEYSAPSKANATIFHLTHRANWQDQLRRSKFALQQHGIAVNGVELPKPSEVDLRKAWTRHKPDLIFHHAFVVSSATMIKLAKEFPGTPIVNVNHSSQTHMFTWPQYMREMRLILDATETLPNFWLASPDAYMPWLNLGYERYTHWPNPVYLPPAPAIPAPLSDPPTLAIVGRTDWMKALPTQIAAAALVQRKRPLRVVLLLNGEVLRKEGLYEHARACRLQYDPTAWMPAEEWEAFLRDQISVVCQPSMSESFNYVSLDGAAFGRPFIGSETIRHTPREWRVKNPNDCYEIAAKLEHILNNYPVASHLARKIAEQVAGRNNQAYASLVNTLITTPHPPTGPS